MKLIVGLGNPGDKYRDTRHNIGFMVVDHLAHELGQSNLPWEYSDKFKAEIARVGEIVLVKPQLFMNASGVPVKALVDFYKLSPGDVWVIHDDLDLPIGKIRLRMGGASAGHHGVDSIIRELKSDKFTRFRLGIGKGRENIGPNSDQKLNQKSVISFVISKFHRREAGDLKHLVKRTGDAVRIALNEGIDKAMNRFN